MRYGFFRLTPGVKNLLIATGVMFLLELLVRRLTGNDFLTKWLCVYMAPREYPVETWLQVWRPFTYVFLHGSLSHLFWNMLGLLLLGPPLEASIGTARFYRVYFVSAVMGALLAILGAAVIGTENYLVGASGAVMGVMFAFITLNPNETFLVWMVLPIRALYLGLIVAGVQLYSALAHTGLSNTSFLAHLGGIAAGFGMARSGFWFENLNPMGGLKRKWRRRHLRPVPARKAALPPEPPFRAVPLPAAQEDMEKQVDAILDKVRVSGMDALSEAERRTLDAHSTRLRQRDHAG